MSLNLSYINRNKNKVCVKEGKQKTPQNKGVKEPEAKGQRLSTSL